MMPRRGFARRAFALLAVALAVSGCVGVRFSGLDLTVENETGSPVSGIVRLSRGNGEVVMERAFEAPPGVSVVEDLTRANGRYDLNVTLDNGLASNISVVAGGPYSTPQVKIGNSTILIFQNEGLPPRSL